jgi:ribonuclease G
MPSILFEDILQNQLTYLTNEKKIKNLTLKVHPYMAVYLRHGLLSRRVKWALKNHCRLSVKAVSSFALLQHTWFDKNGDKIVI